MLYKRSDITLLMLVVPFVLSLVVLAGCGGSGEGTADLGVGPAAISDEATGGTEGFFFLPPLAPDPDSTDPFDPDLVSDLKVEILLLDGNGEPTGDPVAVFTDTSESNTSETIRVNITDKYYIVNFHTDTYDIGEGATYRIFVRRRSDNAEYGYADAQILAEKGRAKSLVDDTTFALKDGRTLPIKFRVEVGALTSDGKIAFASERDGNWEIYVMNADGTGQTRLTNNTAMDWRAAWSPDGSKITFASDRDGNWEIYVMNADGTGQTRLTSNLVHDYDPAWCPDGSRIAFTSARDGVADIYVMNADGTDQSNLTNHPAPAGDGGAAWSPDGSEIAFWSGRDDNWEIYVMNADGTGQTRLTNNPAIDVQPAWSPDGSRIAFTSRRNGVNDIYVMNDDGTGQSNLTNNPANDVEPAWSPDGTSIAFASGRDGVADIYVMNADGTDQRNLTNNPASDREPAWSPN